jgi:hypothetical protein
MTTNRSTVVSLVAAAAAICLSSAANAKPGDLPPHSKWAASWTTAPQGTWRGSGSTQTNALVNFAFPLIPGATPIANNQTLRMIVKPDIWGDTMRVRLMNTWSPNAITIGHVTIGLQSFSGATVAGTNTTVRFNGGMAVTIPAALDATGKRINNGEVVSDPVHVSWAKTPAGDGDGDRDDRVNPVLEGRNLAISMYLPIPSGPLTTHSTALVESFLGAPQSGDHTMDDGDDAFPYETSVFFLVDAVDVVAADDTRVLVGAGSSSVDGSITTPGNNDRFLNWMSRRLHAAYGQHVSVVNEGIGGDVAAIPVGAEKRPLTEVMAERFDRDVLGVSGITDAVFYVGTNDWGDGIPPNESIASLTAMAAKLHALGLNAIGGTLISDVGQNGTDNNTMTAHNTISQFILNSNGVYDSVADFYDATRDPNNSNFLTTVLQPQFATHSDPTGTPDFLHCGRAGAQAEGKTLDVSFFAPGKKRK